MSSFWTLNPLSRIRPTKKTRVFTLLQEPPSYKIMPFWVKKGKRQALCYRWIKWRILNRSYLTNKDMCDSNNAENVFSRVLCFVSVLINMATNSLEPWKCHLLGHENVEKFKRQALCYRWIRMALSYSWEVPVFVINCLR